MSSGGQRQVLLKTSLEKSQAKLVKKLDQATFINSLPKVIKNIRKRNTILFSLKSLFLQRKTDHLKIWFREKSINWRFDHSEKSRLIDCLINSLLRWLPREQMWSTLYRICSFRHLVAVRSCWARLMKIESFKNITYLALFRHVKSRN